MRVMFIIAGLLHYWALGAILGVVERRIAGDPALFYSQPSTGDESSSEHELTIVPSVWASAFEGFIGRYTIQVCHLEKNHLFVPMKHSPDKFAHPR